MYVSPAQDRSVEAALFGFRQVRPDVDVEISVVTPMYNEEGAAGELVREIAAALDGRRFEIVAVDDASSDNTATTLAQLASEIPRLRVLRHARNAGQSRAVRTGVLAAQGAIVVTLDGDGQNVPADIPALLARLEHPDAPPNLMMVAGERQKRRDTVARRAASGVANRLRAAVLKDGAADTGCGLKVFRRDAYLRLPFFDHAHRYLPALMRREGFAVAFVPVSHRSREHGVSKYTNFGRLAVAIRDLLGVMWLIGRARSPERVFEVSRHEERDNV